MAPGNDFCMVQLTTEGAALAGQHPLHVANGRWAYSFPPATPVRVANYEWDLFLKEQATPKGKAIFEIVPAAAAPAPTPIAQPAPAPAAAPVPEAAPTSTPTPQVKPASVEPVAQETK